MTQRYVVGSPSHCCSVEAVIDTTTGYGICETYEIGDAERIAGLLNEARVASADPKSAAKHCLECGELQHESPSGLVCKNGHGGAASLEDDPK